MTVTNTKSINEHVSTGSETSWPFTFDVLEASHITAEVVDLDGVASDVTPSISVDLQTKTVNYGPIPKGYIFRIKRNTPPTQGVDLESQGPLLPEVIENGLDKLTYIVQELRNWVETAGVRIGGAKFRGDWQAGETYTAGDVVVYNGSSWIAAENHTASNPPPDGGKWVLLAEKGDTGSAWTYVDLRVLDDGSKPHVLVSGRETPGDGGGGLFTWVAGDRSSDVSADPLSGVWVAPDSDPSGASGAWQRVDAAQQVVRPEWWGAKGDGSTDDTAAVQAAFDFLSDGGRLSISKKHAVSNLVVQKKVGVSIVQVHPFVGLGSANAESLIRVERFDDSRWLGLRVENISGYMRGIDLQAPRRSFFEHIGAQGPVAPDGIGVVLRGHIDPSGNEYFGSENDFKDIKISGCENGLLLDRPEGSTATHGANLNRFIGGHIQGYGLPNATSLTGYGVKIAYGEGNTFVGVRCLTPNDWTTGYEVRDSVNVFIGCAADGSGGGTGITGNINQWGFPEGYPNNARGWAFYAGSSGSTVLNYLGNWPRDRFWFDSEATFSNITILGRDEFMWLPDARHLRPRIDVRTTSSSAMEFNVADSATSVIAKIKRPTDTVFPEIRYESNGRLEINSPNGLRLSGGMPIDFGTNYVRPSADDAVNLGTGTYRWIAVYARVGTIQTSDARDKTNIQDIPEAWLRAISRIKPKAFKMNGDARWQVGLVAQDIIEAFAQEGVDAVAEGLVEQTENGLYAINTSTMLFLMLASRS